MRVYQDISISDFETWSGAKDTQRVIIENDKENEFDNLIDELYPDGLTDTQLNDILWHESDWVFKTLRISDEGEEETDENE